MRIVTSDLLPDIVKHLKDGIIQATIYQNPFLQGRLGFLNLYKIIAEGASIDNQIYVTPISLTKSNIDLYL
jgi:LacI family transcriptional regulator